MSEDVTIFGLEEVERALHEMAPRLAKKALHDALDYAGSVLQTAQSDLAPEFEGSEKGSPHPAGQLKQDIRRRVKVDMGNGHGVVAVGPSRHSFFGAMREFGTSHESAEPWMRPAWDASAQQALDVFCKVLAAYFNSEVKKKGQG